MTLIMVTIVLIYIYTITPIVCVYRDCVNIHTDRVSLQEPGAIQAGMVQQATRGLHRPGAGPTRN